MTDRELMQQALDALDAEAALNVGRIKDALRKRLAQPEQEPVALVAEGVLVKSEIPQGYTGYLYTTPQPNTIANSKAIPEQISEPVAMRYDFDGYGYRYIDSGSGSNWQTRIKDAEPLYAAPQPNTIANSEAIPKQISEPVQEPVRGVVIRQGLPMVLYEWEIRPTDQRLFTIPPRPEWVGLTEEEKNDCLVSADPCECLAEPEARQLIEDVIDKLREKNT